MTTEIKHKLIRTAVLWAALGLLFLLPLITGCTTLEYRIKFVEPETGEVVAYESLRVSSFATNSMLTGATYQAASGGLIEISEYIKKIDPNSVEAMRADIGDLIALLKTFMPLLIAQNQTLFEQQAILLKEDDPNDF